MRGTQAPVGTFLSAAPQKMPALRMEVRRINFDKTEAVTVKEPEKHEETNCSDDREMLDLNDLEGDEDSGCNHDRRDGETKGTAHSDPWQGGPHMHHLTHMHL